MDGGTLPLCRGTQVTQGVQLQDTLPVPMSAQCKAAAHVPSLPRHGWPAGHEVAAVPSVFMPRAAGMKRLTEGVSPSCTCRAFLPL